MGNIYALVFNSSTKMGTLYSSELRQATSPSGYAQGSAGSWVQLASNLGTNLATGVGSRAMFTAFTTSLGYRKANRTFGANPDNTLYYNDRLLDGQNFWTSFRNAGLSILSIAAEDSNTMYVLAPNGSGKRLVRFKFLEGNCTDNLDNDSNGQIDVEDSHCRGRLATTWCQSHTGSYCIDRIESTEGYSHALVTCNSGGQQPTIQAGRCTKVTPGNDHLTPEPATNEPFGSGHYCNVIKSDGSWDFDFTGSTPCATLLARHPGATIVRAGIYSTNGLNNVHVRCNNSGVTIQRVLEQRRLPRHSLRSVTLTIVAFSRYLPRQCVSSTHRSPQASGANSSSAGAATGLVTCSTTILSARLTIPVARVRERDCKVSFRRFGNGKHGNNEPPRQLRVRK